MHSLNSVYPVLQYPQDYPNGPNSIWPDEPGEVDYSDMTCGDLVAELQLCIETGDTPPLDLTARLMGFGYDVEGLMESLSKPSLH